MADTTHELIRDTKGLRDRVTGLAMESFGGRSRELSMVMTKLDEAELWLIRHGSQVDSSYAVIPKAEVLKIAEARREHELATVTTNETERG